LAAEGDGGQALWSVEEGRQRVDRLGHGAVDAFQSGGEPAAPTLVNRVELSETMLPAMKRSFEHQRARARDRIRPMQECAPTSVSAFVLGVVTRRARRCCSFAVVDGHLSRNPPIRDEYTRSGRSLPP